MKLIAYGLLLVCMGSCGQAKENAKDASKTSKQDSIAKVEKAERTDMFRTDTKYVYMEPDGSEDIDELRETLSRAYATIEELEDKLENAQMAIDDARSKLRQAQMDIEDARMMREPMFLEDAEIGLIGAEGDLDDAETELY